MENESCGSNGSISEDLRCDGIAEDTSTGDQPEYENPGIQSDGRGKPARLISPKSAYHRIGPGLIDAVASSYTAYQESPSTAKRTNYLRWRLRLHLRCNHRFRNELEVANDHFGLGLSDSDVGQTMWNIQGDI